MRFSELSEHLTTLTAECGEVLAAVPETDWDVPYDGSSGWTRAELLGHLIDSAINNQQRFVRALIDNELRFPSYPQNDMVRVQCYREAPADLLIGLWTHLNRHIARVLLQVPQHKLATQCVIGTNTAMTLEQLALDYLAHLEHHLRQLAGKNVLPYSDLSWPPPDRWKTEIGGIGLPRIGEPR